MYLLVTEQEASDLMELSYACSQSSMKNNETWFDKQQWQDGLRNLFGEEIISKLPKTGSIEVKVFKSEITPANRLCDTLPADPVSEAIQNSGRLWRLLEPIDFFKELAGVWP